MAFSYLGLKHFTISFDIFDVVISFDFNTTFIKSNDHIARVSTDWDSLQRGIPCKIVSKPAYMVYVY